jgi:membrane protein YdbS with pleckstrin-like domain
VKTEKSYKPGARQVTRAIEVMMLLVGMLSLIAIVGFGLWLWAQHMYTLGLSVKVKGGLILVSMALVSLIGIGAYLLSRT